MDGAVAEGLGDVSAPVFCPGLGQALDTAHPSCTPGAQVNLGGLLHPSSLRHGSCGP